MTAAGDAGENVAKLVTPAQQAKSSTWPTSEMMTLWREHGGSQHGPRVETATIPLHLLPRFMAAWVSRRVAEVLAERDRLATDLAAARADTAKARDDALEEAARIATDQANEDRKLLKDGLIDYEPAGAAILTSVNIAKAIRAARTAGGTNGRS